MDGELGHRSEMVPKFRMRSFIGYDIEMKEINKTPQYYWSHLNKPLKVSALKLNPPSLTGVLWGRFFKALKCY
jgi:hypothetical protein